MQKDDVKYISYVNILKEELIPAMGCTEPIALAYAAAKARETLGQLPDRVIIDASGSIIKNVKSVIVPNTDHLKGIPAAAVAGIIAGNSDKKLEVIADVTSNQISDMKEYLNNTKIEVNHIDEGYIFDIVVTVFKDNSYAKVRIVDYHTNIVLIEKDGDIIYQSNSCDKSSDGLTNRSVLNLEEIFDFANTVDIDDIKDVISKQIEYNYNIALEGLKGDYGSNIGRILIDTYGDNILIRSKAMAAAGSDARMNGCELPVVINSGSGNQGLTTSLPVIEYAKELKVSEEKMYRALVLANLVTIHQKTSIGRLSAFCGAVSAGAGAGAGIAYLHDADVDAISHTIVNAIVTTGGMVCDGAKASCASKIASSVEAGILGYNMHINGKDFLSGDGLVADSAEQTIKNIGRLAKDGMKLTNEEIIKMMIGK